jgi:hypothetical protein
VQKSSNEQIVDSLRELIVALDRRIPHLERQGEIEITREAAALRKRALERIAECEASDSSQRRM